MTPLPGPVSILLRTNAAAAMAALLLISVSDRDLFAWATEPIGGEEPASLPPKANHPAPRTHKANGVVVNPTFGHLDPTTHVFIPTTNGSVYPGDCLKWGPGLTDAGVVCGGGGGRGGGPITIYTSHSGLVNNVTTPTEAWTVMQQGFYAPGDGGEASYTWNATSLCPGGVNGTPTIPANGLTCILPVGQSPSKPGRYILNLTNGNFNVRQFGMQPGVGAVFDNSPFVDPMMNATGPAEVGPTGPDIIIPATMGQQYTTYYFSQPFQISHGIGLRCSSAGNGGAAGSKVQLFFPAGIPGISQDQFKSDAVGSSDTSSNITACSWNSLGRFGSSNTPGNADPGTTVLNNLTPTTPAGWAVAQPPLAVGDGILVIGTVKPVNGNSLVAPGAYVFAVSSGGGGQNVTLPPGYVIGPQASIFGGPSSAATVFRLPASEMYHVTTVAGSHTATITGGQRPLRIGTWIWSEAFVFGSLVDLVNNAITGTPTVNSGGSGYTGTPGTMTYAGPGCQTPPVLNVTAAAGVITGVTSVANAGRCDGEWPPNTLAAWTPGGGLSGGSGATFNTAFASSVTITAPQGGFAYSPALSGKTGTYNLWGLSAGLLRLSGGLTHGAGVNNFPIAIESFCDNSDGQGAGCSTSGDEDSFFEGGMIGRFVTGSDNAPGTYKSNEYVGNTIVDVLNMGLLPDLYINELANSPENSLGAYNLLANCAGLNATVYIGGYWSGDQSDGACLGADINGNNNIGVAPKPYDIVNQSLQLGIQANVGGMAQIYSGNLGGLWTFKGGNFKFETTNAPTAVGNSTISIAQWFGMLNVGMTVTDLTHPAAIPSSTTVTTFNPGAQTFTISTPVVSPGISNNDRLKFTTTNVPCITSVGGIDINFHMSFGCGGSIPASYDFNMTFNPGLSAWTINNLWMPTPSYLGYNSGADLMLVHGIMLGSADQWSLGHERIIDIDPSSYDADGDHAHLEGDVRFNRKPVPGGNMQWAYVSAFTTTLSANVIAGTTTSVAVAACPNPALPAGTPIDSTNFDDRRHVGDLASCTGTTLTFQAPALVSGASGQTLQFMQNRPAAPIANDAGGKSWTLGNYMTLTPVALASLPATCTAGTFAVINNGVASPTYNAAVGSTTGAATDPVFCTNGNVWKYH
jgi:hypothetical protein